jgi:hypothetical protein
MLLEQAAAAGPDLLRKGGQLVPDVTATVSHPFTFAVYNGLHSRLWPLKQQLCIAVWQGQ